MGQAGRQARCVLQQSFFREPLDVSPLACRGGEGGGGIWFAGFIKKKTFFFQDGLQACACIHGVSEKRVR